MASTRNAVLRTILALLALGLLVAAAKPDPASKVQKIAKIASQNRGLVELDSASYEEFTRKPRSYGIAVLLTALGAEFKCAPCTEFDPEYRIVASSFQRTTDSSRIFFGHLDFKDGREVYAKLRLTSAPTLLYFPPTDGPHAKLGVGDNEPLRYEYNRNGFSAEPLAEWLSSIEGISVPVKRPTNWFAVGGGIFGVLAVAAVIKLLYTHLATVFRSKNTWAAIALVEILMMISGHMWNHIRKPPYVIGNGQGGISYIAQGFQNQIGLESQIVAVMYAILAFSTVSLAVTVPRMDDKMRQRLGVYIWMVCLIVMFSFLMALFKIKNQGYPFKLLF